VDVDEIAKTGDVNIISIKEIRRARSPFLMLKNNFTKSGQINYL
jgi:hypothetical protein